MTLPPNSLTWGEDTYWERVARSSWGSYITGVEERVILRLAIWPKGQQPLPLLRLDVGGTVVKTAG
jgi:hypothetical protein